MRLFKRGKRWHVEFQNGQRRSLGKEVQTDAEAKRVYNEIRRQALAGKLAEITGQCQTTLGEYKGEFEEWAKPVQNPSTFRANMLALSKLEHYAGKTCKLDRIGIKHVDLMISDGRKEGLSPASINNYIRHMRAALNKAKEWGYVKTNPLREATEQKEDKKPPEFMERVDIPKFLASIRDIDLRRMVTAYLCTGRRRSELLNLRWEDVDLERDRYAVTIKGGDRKWFPINSMFRATLASIDGESGRVFARWNHPDTISHYVKRALLESGHGHLHLHHLRHTFASQQVMQGKTLVEVQQLLGHSEMKTTLIYAHLSEDHLRQASEINLGGPVDLGGKKK